MMFELLGLVMFPRTNRNFQADDVYLWLREYHSKEGKKKVQKTCKTGCLSPSWLMAALRTKHLVKLRGELSASKE